jgi:hypothetical protein
MRQPWPDWPVSVAIRQRSRPGLRCVGKFTTVVTNPPELPLQAIRPAIGLSVVFEIMELYPPEIKLPPD